MNTKKTAPLPLSTLLGRVASTNIASIRSTVTALLNMLNDQDSKSCEIKKLLQIDPPLAAKLLQVANSPYYAPRRKIHNIDEAFIWIGLDVLKEILLTQKLGEIFQQGPAAGGYSRSALWRHSLAVAIMAKMIYRREFGEKGQNAYAAGLMHDIGLIVEDQLAPQEFGQILDRTQQECRFITEQELEVLGYDHGNVGQALVEAWGFPESLREGIGFHHRPEMALSEHAVLAKTIFIADHLMFAHGYGYLDTAPPDQEAFQRYADELGLNEFALRALVRATLDDLHELGE